MEKRNRSIRRRPVFCEALENRLLFSLPAAWTSVGVGGGGSFFEPSFNPGNPNEIWVATDQTDEYHSTNGGASWTVPSFTSIQGNHAAPVQYTSTPNLLFALGPSNYPQKSTDGGQTWTVLANNPAGNADSFIVNYNNPSEFFISSYSQIYFTSNGGASYSTINSSSGYVAGAYFNGGNIYLATDQGLLTSANGGSTFSSTPFSSGIPAGDGIFSFAGSTAGGITTFFAVTASESDIYPGQEGNICYSFTGLYTLTAGQTSWTKVNGIPAGIDPAFVSMVPNDITDIVLAGGSSSGAPTVVKSNNGGVLWTNLFNTTNNANIETGWQGYGGVDSGWGYGEFAMGFAQNPDDPSEMMITDEGGAHLSTDGGATWRAVYVNPADLHPAGSATPKNDAYQGNGMENTSSWSLAFTSPTNMLASFTDITGISSADGGNTWSFNDDNGNSYNTTYQIVIQPQTENLYAAVSNTHDIYQWDAYQTNTRIDAGNGAVLVSVNGGSNWTTLHNFNHPVVFEEIDPNNPDTMYVSVANSKGAGGIYMTSDLQDGTNSVWKQLAVPPRTEGHPLDIVVLNDGTLIATYAGTLNSSGLFDDSSGVFVSANQGASWTDVAAGTSAMQYFDRDITVDPNDPTQSTWYVGVWATTSDPYYPEGGLYKTTNRGQTWTLVPGLPDQEFSQVAFNPSNTNEMYITTGDDGLWYTADAEAAKPTFQQVPSYPFQAPQRVFFNPYVPNQVWVTSFGYGLAVGNEPSSGIAFTGAADGVSWGNAGNWSDNLVPTQSDSVTIPIGFSIQIGAGAYSVGAITSSSPIEVLASGSLKLFGATAITGTLTIDTGGIVDIQNNPLTINYGSAANDPMAALRSDLHSAYSNGAWSGSGLTSSMAEANVGKFAIGYLDNTTTDQLSYALTVPGDANLSDATDFNDLTAVGQFFGTSVAKGNVVNWQSGDVNYDGQVDFNDLSIVAQYFGDSMAKTQAALLAGTAVVIAPPTPSVTTPPSRYIAPPPALVVHAPSLQATNAIAMPEDGIGSDVLVGVWKSVSPDSSLLS